MSIHTWFMPSDPWQRGRCLLSWYRSSSWHVLTNFPKRIYEFFLPKYYVITILIYSTVQNWENNHKEFVCFFNRQMLARKSVDSCSENSWKHVMNSIIADTRSCQRECRMIEDCKFFTMFGVNDDPTDHMKCLLFKTCDPLEACDDCITGIYNGSIWSKN